jgi:hypothetical protein
MRGRITPQFMLKFVDSGGRTWWYQQIPYIEITLIPVGERPPSTPVSLDQACVSGSIISFCMLSACCCRGDCSFYKL